MQKLVFLKFCCFDFYCYFCLWKYSIYWSWYFKLKFIFQHFLFLFPQFSIGILLLWKKHRNTDVGRSQAVGMVGLRPFSLISKNCKCNYFIKTRTIKQTQEIFWMPNVFSNERIWSLISILAKKNLNFISKNSMLTNIKKTRPGEIMPNFLWF